MSYVDIFFIVYLMSCAVMLTLFYISNVLFPEVQQPIAFRVTAIFTPILNTILLFLCPIVFTLSFLKALKEGDV
jgi:hypothetical protein